jgi:hypothetical protein
MEGFIATKLDEFAKGKISRRALLETLTVAATTRQPGPQMPPPPIRRSRSN